MRELIHSKQVTASKIPAISFAARGTLLHDQPSFEKWCFSYFIHLGKQCSEAEIRRMLLACTIQLNDRVLSGNSENPGAEFFLSALVQKYFPENERARELQAAIDHYRASMKIVIPSLTIRVCEELISRGYKLVVLSNEDESLIEVFKMYQLLDLFEAVILASEVGTSKPGEDIFKAALEDLSLQPEQLVHVGDRYATDVVGAQRANIGAILYDPRQYEVLALNRLEDTSEKVVSIDALRKNRALQNVKVITKFEELLDFFK